MKWIYLDEVIEYFIELENVLKKAEKFKLNPRLYSRLIIGGLSNRLGFRGAVEVEAVEREIDNVNDLQTLILEMTEELEGKFIASATRRPPKSKTDSSKSAKIGNHRPHGREMKIESQSDHGNRTQTAPAPRNMIKCFNCNGPHAMMKCIQPFYQPVIQANKLARDEDRRRQSTVAPKSTRIATHNLQLEWLPSTTVPNVDAMKACSHVQTTLVDFNKQIVAHFVSGSEVSIIRSNLVTELQNAGCVCRKVDKKIRSCNGSFVQITNQLVGI
jgi:hypothetical protein